MAPMKRISIFTLIANLILSINIPRSIQKSLGKVDFANDFKFVKSLLS